MTRSIDRTDPDGETSRPRRRAGWLGDRLLTLYGVLVLLFLFLPIVVVVPMSFSAASSLTFPPTEFSLRWYLSFFQDARWLAAMRTSLLVALRSEEHTSELQSLMRISYAVFCL